MNRNAQNLRCGQVIADLPAFFALLRVDHALEIVEAIKRHAMSYSDSEYPETYGRAIDDMAEIDLDPSGPLFMGLVLGTGSKKVDTVDTCELVSVSLGCEDAREFAMFCLGRFTELYLWDHIDELRSALKAERKVRVEVSVTVWVDGKEFAREIWDEEETAASCDDLMFDGAHEADQWLNVTLGEVFED